MLSSTQGAPISPQSLCPPGARVCCGIRQTCIPPLVVGGLERAHVRKGRGGGKATNVPPPASLLPRPATPLHMRHVIASWFDARRHPLTTGSRNASNGGGRAARGSASNRRQTQTHTHIFFAGHEKDSAAIGARNVQKTRKEGEGETTLCVWMGKAFTTAPKRDPGS